MKLKTFRPAWIPPRLPPRVVSTKPKRKADSVRGLPNNFYQSAAWRELRAAKLRTHPACERCMRRGVSKLAELVHHVESIEVAPSRALDLTNLESSCRRCHNRLHPEKGRARG